MNLGKKLAALSTESFFNNFIASMQNINNRLFPLSFCLAITAFSLGCGDGREKPQTFHVSGNVTFQGKPVPAGRIDFIPDASAGNSGVAGYAEIANGAYDTSRTGKGTTGGAQVAVISGAVSPDAPQALSDEELANNPPPSTALFRDFRAPIELPMAAAKQDFQVPDSAAARR